MAKRRITPERREQRKKLLELNFLMRCIREREDLAGQIPVNDKCSPK